MARQSSIDKLPPEFRDALNELLRDPRVTQLDAAQRVNEMLEQSGEDERVSKSAVNRYAIQMDKVGAKLRQSRQVAEMWIGKLGSEPSGQVGHLLNEVVRNLAFDTAIALSEGDEPVEPKLIKELSIAIERLEKASSENEKRAAEIRRKTAEEAADKASEKMSEQGMSAESIATIKRDILGIA
ncbi:MAG: DUF3486 family protein [Cycloclasticus sp.]